MCCISAASGLKYASTSSSATPSSGSRGATGSPVTFKARRSVDMRLTRSTKPPIGGSASLGLGRNPQVRLEGLPAGREQRFGLFVLDRRDDDHVLALLPVDRRRDLVLCRQLERVDHAQQLVEVAAGARG